MLWKYLEIMCDFIFYFFAAMAQQQAPPFPQPVVVLFVLLGPLLDVLPELFDERTDRVRRSYHSAVSGAELGPVRFRGPGHYMSLHPRWCPKYVI
jgi:hypothetical protein